MGFIEYFLHLLISSYVWIIWIYLVQILSNKQHDMRPANVCYLLIKT